MMNAKLNFATTINDRNDRLPKGRSVCFDWGSNYGCTVDCPAFNAGDCDVPADAIDAFRDEIDDIEEVYEMYPEIKEATK